MECNLKFAGSEVLPSWSVPLSRGAVVLVTGLTQVQVAGVGIGLKVETRQSIMKGKKIMKDKYTAFLHMYSVKA